MNTYYTIVLIINIICIFVNIPFILEGSTINLFAAGANIGACLFILLAAYVSED